MKLNRHCDKISRLENFVASSSACRPVLFEVPALRLFIQMVFSDGNIKDGGGGEAVESNTVTWKG